MRARISATIAALLFGLLSPALAPTANAAVADGVGINTNGLLFYYDVANYAGMASGTQLADLSGNGRTATITQVSSQPTTSTNNGGHLSFNASGGYVTGTSMSSITNSFSLSFYANFGTQANNFERIIDFGNGAANNNLEVGREGTGTNLFIEMFNGGASPGYCRATGAIDSSWHFWVVTMGNGLCNIYKDNVRIVTDAAYSGTVGSTTWTNMYIGKSNWSADAAFEGGIGELAFYNRALTSTEAAQNYNAAIDQSAPTLSTLSLTQSLSIVENATNVGSLTGSEVGTQYKMLTGSDSAKFSLSPFGGASTSLSFISAPNFEAPGSALSSNVYTAYALIYDSSGNWNTLTLTITVTNVVELATMTFNSLSGNPYKGAPVIISVTPAAGGTAGKVSYLANGKRIPRCYRINFTGSGISSCSWKPANRGSQELTITFTPNGSEYGATTLKKIFFVNKRTTNR